METDGAAGGGDASVRMKTDIKSSHVYTVKITSYGWDQSDKFMKLYITLKGIETLPKDNCLVQFGEESVTICVSNLNGKNHELIIKTLLNPIIPSDSHFKIKTDMLVVFMKKKDKQTWAYVTKGDMKNKEKKPPKMDNADPSAGIMNMMKNMYEEGDDDMKRTIAKAWTESRDKQMNPDIGDMGM
uniref:Calcyclin-binding protein-like n=1 Tax=Saccoglossus kowalevskii TaxID=10224 RepID=A0ABM0MG57_SACKO|nr:PREDICTED: calcyclin-binding protein-like [Saccoglossus kowalevskii]